MAYSPPRFARRRAASTVACFDTPAFRLDAALAFTLETARSSAALFNALPVVFDCGGTRLSGVLLTTGPPFGAGRFGVGIGVRLSGILLPMIGPLSVGAGRFGVRPGIVGV